MKNKETKKVKKVNNNAKEIVAGLPDEDLKELMWIIYNELCERHNVESEKLTILDKF